jgi:hypothetical protein
LVYFVVIWYIFPPFGILDQEKSGNPGHAALMLSWTVKPSEWFWMVDRVFSFWKRDLLLNGWHTFFLRGSVIPFPVGFCCRQVAIMLRSLGIIVIISTPYP